MELMARCSTLMGQLLQLMLRHVFDHLVDSHAWPGAEPPEVHLSVAPGSHVLRPMERPQKSAGPSVQPQLQKQNRLGLLQLIRLAQTMLMERLELWALLCPPPPDNRQPSLFN